MAAAAKKAEPARDEPNLPEDAKQSQHASAGHGTPEAKARVVESTGGPDQPSVSQPAQEEMDEGQRQGFIKVKLADQDELKKEETVTPLPEYEAALSKGYIGSQADDTPNEHYTVAGVTSGKKTPENPEGRTGLEQR